MIVFFKKVKKTQQQISPSINVLLFKLISAVIYKNDCRIGPKQTFQICHNRILSIRRISEKVLNSVSSESEFVTALVSLKSHH